MNKKSKNNYYLFKETDSEELIAMREFNARFFRRAEIKIKEEKRKQKYYAKRQLEEIGRYD